MENTVKFMATFLAVILTPCTALMSTEILAEGNIEIQSKAGLGGALHSEACRLLNSRHINTQQKEQMLRHINVNSSCGESGLPIFIAMNHQDRFDDIMKLEPDLLVKNAQGKSPLQIALKKRNENHTRHITSSQPRLLSSLSYNDVKPVANNSNLITYLKYKGLPSTIGIEMRAEEECNNRSFDNSKGGIYQDYFLNNWKLFQKYSSTENQKELLAVLKQYKTCLNKNFFSLDNKVVFWGSEHTRPSIREDNFLGPAKSKTIEAMSYLSPRNLKSQDLYKAQLLLKEAFDEVQESANEFKVVAQRYMDKEQREYEQKQAELEKKRKSAERWAIFNTVLGAAVGAYAYDQGAAPDQAAQFSMDLIEISMNDFHEQIERINDIKLDTPEYVSSVRMKAFQDDGVRLLVPRFGNLRSHGALESRASLNHTPKVIHLYIDKGGLRSSCTAAVVGYGLILTAQHCILDNNNRLATSVRASYEWLGVPYKSNSLEVLSDIVSGPWKVTTSKGSWMDGWKNDWAVLEKEDKEDKESLPYWMKTGLVLARKGQYRHFISDKKNRVSIAGYSSHLNNGKFLTMDWGCRIKNNSNGILNHRCKGFKGDSGAPIVAANTAYKGLIMGVESHGPFSEDVYSDPTLAPTSGGAVSAEEIRDQHENYSEVVYIK